MQLNQHAAYYAFFVLLTIVYTDSFSTNGCPSGNNCKMQINCKPRERELIVGQPKPCDYDIRLNAWRGICCPDSTGGNCSNSPGIPKEVHDLDIVDAEQGAWPWMVVIMMNDGKGQFNPICSGYMIDKRHMISAAFCFETNQSSLYSARIGDVDFRKGESYEFARIKIPEDYTPGQYYNDIALITLTRDVKNPDFTPICLPPKSAGNLEGRGATLVRWGKTRPGGPMSFTLKQLGGLHVVFPHKCSYVFEENFHEFPNQFPKGINKFICAGFMDGKRRDSFGGDAGSPLMILENDKWYAVGVASFGYYGSYPENYPGGYTRITEYLDWISENKN